MPEAGMLAVLTERPLVAHFQGAARKEDGQATSIRWFSLAGPRFTTGSTRCLRHHERRSDQSVFRVTWRPFSWADSACAINTPAFAIHEAA